MYSCQGFTGCTPVRVRDGSLPKGLNEYPTQLPRLGQLRTRVLRSGLNGSELPKNESGVSRDLASAYVLCLRTLVVPNLQRDEGGSLGK